MAANYLEQLIAEWRELRGYFVRRNVMVEKRTKGGYDCELDVVAFHPQTGDLVPYEASMDAHAWKKRDTRYRKKFDAGIKHIPTLFAGLTGLPKTPRQIAVVGFGSTRNYKVLGGAKIKLVLDLLVEILSDLRNRPIASKAIPEQYALLRTLQFVAEYWSSINKCLTDTQSKTIPHV